MAKGVKGSSLESIILNTSIAASKKCAHVYILKIEGHKVRIDRYSQKYSLNKKSPTNQTIKQESKQGGRQPNKNYTIASRAYQRFL